MMFDTKLAEIGALKAKLTTFPRGLFEARQRMYDAEQRVKGLKAEVADAELEELLVASTKLSPEGKKAYPNEEARKAAVAIELGKSPTHRDRLKRLADAESEALNAKLEVSRLEDEQRAFRAVADVTIAEVQLLVAGR